MNLENFTFAGCLAAGRVWSLVFHRQSHLGIPSMSEAVTFYPTSSLAKCTDWNLVDLRMVFVLRVDERRCRGDSDAPAMACVSTRWAVENDSQSPPSSSSSAFEHILQSHYNSGEQQLYLTLLLEDARNNEVWSLLTGTRNKSIYIWFIYIAVDSTVNSPKARVTPFTYFTFFVQ